MKCTWTACLVLAAFAGWQNVSHAEKSVPWVAGALVWRGSAQVGLKHDKPYHEPSHYKLKEEDGP